MPRIEWTPTAVASLDGIFDYFGKQNHSPEEASKLLRQFDAKCSSYARQPLMGSERSDLGKNVRCFHVGSYVVIYRPEKNDGILVLTVVHGSRDIPTIFRNLFDPGT